MKFLPPLVVPRWHHYHRRPLKTWVGVALVVVVLSAANWVGVWDSNPLLQRLAGKVVVSTTPGESSGPLLHPPAQNNTLQVPPTNVTTETAADANNYHHHQPNKTILYVIRSYPGRYQSRVTLQVRTWIQQGLQLAHEGILLASIFESGVGHQWTKERTLAETGLQHLAAAYPTAIQVSMPWCPESSHGVGLCCQEAQALLQATIQQAAYDWIFVIDEDVYVHPPLIRQALAAYDPRTPIAIGTIGCGAVLPGFCGGGGYAISKTALRQLTAVPNYYETYMDLCRNKEQYCDIITAYMMQHEANVTLVSLPTLHPWGFTPQMMEQHVPQQTHVFREENGTTITAVHVHPEYDNVPTPEQQAQYLERLHQVETEGLQQQQENDTDTHLLQLLPSMDVIRQVRSAIQFYASSNLTTGSMGNHPGETNATIGEQRQQNIYAHIQSMLTQIRLGHIATLHYYGGHTINDVVGDHAAPHQKMALLHLLFRLVEPI